MVSRVKCLYFVVFYENNMHAWLQVYCLLPLSPAFVLRTVKFLKGCIKILSWYC